MLGVMISWMWGMQLPCGRKPRTMVMMMVTMLLMMMVIGTVVGAVETIIFTANSRASNVCVDFNVSNSNSNKIGIIYVMDVAFVSGSRWPT